MRSALLLFSVGVCSALLLPRTVPVGQRTTVRMSASGSTADYLASTIGPRAAVRLAEGDDAIAGLQAEFEEAAAAGAAALEEAAEALEDAADLEDTAMELDAEEEAEDAGESGEEAMPVSDTLGAAEEEEEAAPEPAPAPAPAPPPPPPPPPSSGGAAAPYARGTRAP